MIRAGRLAIVQIGDKKYYEDIRLLEYRNVDDFSDRILFSEVGSRKIKRLENRIELGTPEWDAYVDRIRSRESQKLNLIKKRVGNKSKGKRL